jgi:hypothetical protein
MIRIDEIYNNTFWPYIQKQLPLTRMFYCDPPGKSDPEHLCNYGSDITEHNYIILHDQEPIHLDIHTSLFEDAERRNKDLNNGKGPSCKAIITSEYLSEDVEYLKEHYGYNHYYYFFHGWAALDWYRGYDKTFLLTPFDHRNIKKTFLFPNNIVGGKRKHRLALLKELEKRHLINNNFISCPAVCPYENISVTDLFKQYSIDPIETDLPLTFDNFDNHAHNSHQITMWDQSASSLLQVVSETMFYGNKLHLTEKTFKPIVMQQPFVLASCKGSLEYLRKYGFETFSSVWDESYDTLPDDLRITAIGNLLQELEHSNCREWLSEQCSPIVEHNFNHFYGGAFESILWDELNHMLEQIKNDFCI